MLFGDVERDDGRLVTRPAVFVGVAKLLLLPGLLLEDLTVLSVFWLLNELRGVEDADDGSRGRDLEDKVVVFDAMLFKSDRRLLLIAAAVATFFSIVDDDDSLLVALGPSLLLLMMGLLTTTGAAGFA